MFKIVLIAIFFSVDISYAISELLKGKTGSEGYLPILGQIRRETIHWACSRLLGSICVKRGRNRVLIVDSTDVTLDLNWFRKKITKADLEGKEFKWGYSSSKGYYIGYKLTLVIEYPSLRPVAFLLHQGSPCDAKIYEEILEELKRRRIARDGDTIIFDPGLLQQFEVEVLSTANVRALLRAAMPLPQLTPDEARALLTKHLVNRTRSRKSRMKGRHRGP